MLLLKVENFWKQSWGSHLLYEGWLAHESGPIALEVRKPLIKKSKRSKIVVTLVKDSNSGRKTNIYSYKMGRAN